MKASDVSKNRESGGTGGAKTRLNVIKKLLICSHARPAKYKSSVSQLFKRPDKFRSRLTAYPDEHLAQHSATSRGPISPMNAGTKTSLIFWY